MLPTRRLVFGFLGVAGLLSVVPDGASAQTTNLALSRPASASSLESTAFPASAAVDGSASTRWSSLSTDPQWLTVDLGATASIGRVKLSWEAAYGAAYQI